MATQDASRRELEASVVATASSIDGRRFTYQCSVHGLELQSGGYVSIGEQLGQVHSVEVGEEVSGSSNVRIAVAHGHGILLEDGIPPFHATTFERAGEAAVAAWLERARPTRAALDVGALVLEPEVRFSLDPGGFDRHTFFCGQSGSGKTYALGTVLERLLLETTLRIVVLDPNSDFVCLHEVRDGVDDAMSSRYRQAAAGLSCAAAGQQGRSGSTCASPTVTQRSRLRCCASNRSATVRNTVRSSTSSRAGSRTPARAHAS
jgi:uncharacterized protein